MNDYTISYAILDRIKLAQTYNYLQDKCKQ